MCLCVFVLISMWFFKRPLVLVVPPHVPFFTLLSNPGEKLGKERDIIKQYCMKKGVYVCTCTCLCVFELCVVGFVAFGVFFSLGEEKPTKHDTNYVV